MPINCSRPNHILFRASLSERQRSCYGTFTWTTCPSVSPQSLLWQNGWLDPDAVWEVSGVGRGMGVRGWLSSKGKGKFWGWIWGIPL